MIAEHSDVCLNPLVVVLYLALCLRVVGHGKLLVNVEGLEEVVCIVGGASVCVVDLWDSVKPTHVGGVTGLIVQHWLWWTWE
jgi:hypothetical protein